MTEIPKEQKIEALYNNYDNLIVKCVPNYHKILETIANNIDGEKGEMLDIGVGTGNLEKFIFKKFPQAKITGIDTSAEFLNTAKKKYKAQQFKTVQADIKKYEMGENKFCNVLACLAIHHFEDEEKKKLFQNIYQALKENGNFINFDMIKPETEVQFKKLQGELFQRWRSKGLSENFIEQEKKEMSERDKLVELPKQKKWLEEIGFDFRVIYEDGFFCIYICKK